jgi:chromosome segregation ATPase
MKPKFSFLLTEHTAEAPLNTATATGAPAAAAETPAAETAPAAEVKPAGLVERIMSRFEEKTELTTRTTNLESQLQSITAERDGLAQSLQTVTADRDQLANEKAQIETALNAAEAKVKTVNEAAADIAAAASFPSASLPAAAEAPQDTIASLEKQLTASTDPKERQQIALKIKQAQKENAG